MSFVDIDLEDTKEPEVAPEATYDLVIASAEEKMSKSDKPMIQVGLVIEGDNDYQMINHFLSLPMEGDEPKTVKFKKLSLARFLQLFNIPQDGGFNVEDFYGATASCLVAQGEANEKGQIFNELRVPKLES